MVSCNNMLLLYMAIEIQSLCFHVFPALRRISNSSIEASIKYYIYSITSTVIFLIGLSFIYGSYGTVNFSELMLLSPGTTNNLVLNTSLFFISVLILSKPAIFPSHTWIPAVYEGSPLIITLFFATVAKIPFIFLLIKFILVFGLSSHSIMSVLQFLAISSVIYGSIVALTQVKLKKLLAYSAISHMGFILLGVLQNTIDGISAGIFYFTIYLFLTFSTFAILVFYKYLRNNDVIELDKTTDLIRLYRTNPILAFMFATLLSSMAGIPPFIGSFSKWYIFLSFLSSHDYLTLIIVIFTNLYSSLFYIRLVRNIFFDKDLIFYGDYVISNSYPSAFLITIFFFFNLLFFLFHSVLLSIIKVVVLSSFVNIF